MSLPISISGSFQKFLSEIREDIEVFSSLNCTVLSPQMFNSSWNNNGFVILDTDGQRTPENIHACHLNAIKDSKFLWVRNPSGYIGLSTALEVGFAHSLGIQIFSSNDALERIIDQYMITVGSPVKALDYFKMQ